jgi:hypothetical protein
MAARASIQPPTPTGDESESNLIQPPNAPIYHSVTYETTPLLSFAGPNVGESFTSLSPAVLHPSGRNYNNTSNRVYNSTGKYTSVPKYPSNTYQRTIPGLFAVLITVVLQSIGFTLVLPSMYLYLKSV